jgi:farnesyl diphosphate synthase
LAQIEKMGLPAHATKYIREVMDYNVPGGKLTRGVTTVRCTRLLFESKGLVCTEEVIDNAIFLGWCVELVSGGTDADVSGACARVSRECLALSVGTVRWRA